MTEYTKDEILDLLKTSDFMQVKFNKKLQHVSISWLRNDE